MKLLRCASALLAVLLAACTVTVTSPVLEKLGAGISISGGTLSTAAVTPSSAPASTPSAPATPAVDPTVSMFVNGAITGAPYVTSSTGSVYAFDPKTAVTGQVGAGFTVNGIAVPGNNATVLKRGGDGNVYFYAVWGAWLRFRDTDVSQSGTVPQTPPTAAPASGGSTAAAPPGQPQADPAPNAVAPGSSGKVTPVAPGGLKAAIAAASPGDTLKASPGVYAESAALPVPLLIDGGGTITNPGTATASFSGGAELAGETVAAYAQGQGGFVPLTDTKITGWNIHGFGLQAQAADGTGGVRNNGDGIFDLESSYVHDNEMGVGPHAGGNSVWHLKNDLFLNNGLVANSGYAHNLYLMPLDVLIDGGITSIVEPGKGGGHALKSRAPKLTINGQNYFYASESSSVDIPDGTATPVLITANDNGGTTIEKKSGDANHTLLDYGVESTSNGLAGVKFIGPGHVFKVPDDGTQWLIITQGPIDLSSVKFVNSKDNTTLKHGVISVQGSGAVTGLP